MMILFLIELVLVASWMIYGIQFLSAIPFILSVMNLSVMLGLWIARDPKFQGSDPDYKNIQNYVNTQKIRDSLNNIDRKTPPR